MPQTGHFILHSNVLPPLTAGKYQLQSEHTGTPFAVADEQTHVTVAAPRYTMPTEQILSSFPPANAEGAFGDRLPQIVLKRRTLPWERNPFGQTAPSPVPWLALVVVAEGEAELSATVTVDQCTTPGTTLLDPADHDVEQGIYLAVTETVVDKIFPCEEDLRHLVHVREVDINDTELANGDDDGWLAVVMANRLPVFDTATGSSVRYLACLVNLEGQLPALPPPRPAVDFFEYAVVQDWSVLASVTTSTDHLVMGTEVADIAGIVLPGSGLLDGPADAARAGFAGQGAGAQLTVGAALDGSASAMTEVSIATQWATATENIAAVALDPDAKVQVRDRMKQGWQYPIELYAVEQVFRFPVLAHWSFTTNEGATFETLMQDLGVSLIGSIPEPGPGDPPPAGPPPEVVETGHIGLDHRTRRGDPTRAWFRGPLTPFPTQRDAPVDGALPVPHSADQLRRVVPDGREDLSLAAAFEIGRLLGLSQLSVVSALLRFRGEQFGAGRIREVLDLVTDFALPGLLAEVDFGRFVALQTLDGMVVGADDTIGPRRPIADPGREINVRGELDAVIAGGLGLDLAALRKTGERIGVVAALAQTKAPIAHPDGGKFDERSVGALRDTLDTELAGVIDVAAPRPVLGDAGAPAGGRGRRRQARRDERPADVLDDLIDDAERRTVAEEGEAR
ncbi:MAG: hypothetical protein ACR2HQ_05780 [Ilumatobacteraceae bacterium]